MGSSTNQARQPLVFGAQAGHLEQLLSQTLVLLPQSEPVLMRHNQPNRHADPRGGAGDVEYCVLCFHRSAVAYCAALHLIGQAFMRTVTVNWSPLLRLQGT